MKRTTFTKNIQLPTQPSSRPSEDEIRKMLTTVIADMKEQQAIPVVTSPKPDRRHPSPPCGETVLPPDSLHLDPDGVEYIRRNLGKLLDRFVKSIDYSDKWVAVYQYGSETSRIRPIYEITSAQLYNQLFDEGFIDPGTVEYIDPFESGGAFIPFLIDSLNSLKFINLKYHKLDGNALAAVTRKLSPFTKKSLHAAMVQNDLKLDAASQIGRAHV